MQALSNSSTPSAVPPSLSVRHLRIALPAGADRPHAVDDVSFDVAPGKVVCLIGESGSGKSVIAQAVMGLLPDSLRPTGGTIQLLGEDVLQASPSRLRELRGTRMAMVFQEPMTALNPVMRCGDQVSEMLQQQKRQPLLFIMVFIMVLLLPLLLIALLF